MRALTHRAGTLKAALQDAARAAKHAGLRPYVALGASWCKPCAVLAAMRDDPARDALFSGTMLIDIDIDAWGDELIGAGFRIDRIPAFQAVDAAGRPWERAIDGSAWGADSPDAIARVLGPYFHPSIEADDDVDNYGDAQYRESNGPCVDARVTALVLVATTVNTYPGDDATASIADQRGTVRTYRMGEAIAGTGYALVHVQPRRTKPDRAARVLLAHEGTVVEGRVVEDDNVCWMEVR